MPPATNRNQSDPSLPPLAQYRELRTYIPTYGDYIVWSGWFTTWHGVVANYDKNTNEVAIIWAGVPFVLFTLDDEEQERETKSLNLAKIRAAVHGTFAIMQHDFTQNANIWYL